MGKILSKLGSLLAIRSKTTGGGNKLIIFQGQFHEVPRTCSQSIGCTFTFRVRAPLVSGRFRGARRCSGNPESVRSDARGIPRAD